MYTMQFCAPARNGPEKSYDKQISREKKSDNAAYGTLLDGGCPRAHRGGDKLSGQLPVERRL